MAHLETPPSINEGLDKHTRKCRQITDERPLKSHDLPGVFEAIRPSLFCESVMGKNRFSISSPGDGAVKRYTTAGKCLTLMLGSRGYKKNPPGEALRL
ncbi:MAG: hypothetical protein JRI95_05645 [Deltaproteobacteria bacterium]|nr:hypothetical protein [Deltaproteobacteria bacterium]MBW2085151.1 hypothetical protein [Deltaproteobacteria bacterium]